MKDRVSQDGLRREERKGKEDEHETTGKLLSPLARARDLDSDTNRVDEETAGGGAI